MVAVKRQREKAAFRVFSRVLWQNFNHDNIYSLFWAPALHVGWVHAEIKRRRFVNSCCPRKLHLFSLR